jgi:hypothetical protein
MAAKKSKKATKLPAKKSRSLNAGAAQKKKPGAPSSPGSEQDVKRRLGHFTTAGEPPRTGRRGS